MISKRIITQSILLLFFLVCSPERIHANKETDSLNHMLLDKSVSDKDRILVLNNLYSYYLNTDINAALHHITESIILAEQFENEEIFAQTSYLYSNILSLQGDSKESIAYLFKALNYYEKHENFEYVTNCLHSIGENYRAQAEHDKALNYLFRGLNLAKKHQIDDEVKSIYNRISAVLYEKKETQKSLAYADSSLKYKPELNSSDIKSNNYNIIGAIYKDLGKFNLSLQYLHKSLYLGKVANDWIHIPGSYINIASLHLEQSNYDSCIYYAKESLKISNKSKILTYQETALLQLYNAFKGTHSFDSALKYHEDYTGIRWQIFNKARSEKIVEIQTKYDVEKRARENEKLLTENELQKNNNAKLKIIILMIILAVSAALYISFVLNRKRLQLKKTNELLNKQNEEIEKQSKQLAELNKTKDKILSIIAHDMTNPFQSILGFSTLLASDVEDCPKNIRQYAEYISQGTQNLNTLLSNLLKWSQLQLGSFKLNKESISIYEISKEVQDLFDTALKEKRINFIADIAKEHKAHCDLHSVSTVIRNLVSNAIKFTRFDGTIKVSSKLSEDELEFTIQDNGVGMDEGNLNKLFSMDKTISFGTNYEKGSGFGLILCKEFVETNGGKIWAESEVNKGTTIHFTLLRN